jgi:hypothetical protein
MVDVLVPETDGEATDAEALFPEAKQRARRRAIRRIVAVMLAVVVLGTLLALIVVSRSTGSSGPKSAASLTGSVAGQLPREAIQIRPVLATSASSCRAVNIRENSNSLQTVSLPAPSGSLPGVPTANGAASANGSQGCALLGPSVLSTSKISAVDLGRSEAGLVTVTVVMDQSDVARLRTATWSHPTKFYAVVALGQVLSYPTGSQLSTIGTNGQFQVAGGLSTGDARPNELGNALRTRIVEAKPLSSPLIQG